MNHNMETKLISCLDQLEQGESVESILAQFPADAEEFRPFLETAAQLPQLASRPTLAVQQQSQAAFLAQAAILASPQSSPVPFWVMLRRILMPVASLAAVLIFLIIGLISVSASALPGDGLYNVKRTVEAFRLQVASDPEQILGLAEKARQERLREVEALLRTGKTADVMFEGEIESIGTSTWIIADLTVQLDPATIIDGTPQVGELAMVDGRTADGLLLAGKIIILTGTPEAQETPLPVIIPLVEPEDTSEPSVTPTASLSPTPTATRPTATPSPTPAQLPTETVELAPPPTATLNEPPVTPPSSDDNNDNDDDENDNGLGDNGDDNGGDSNDNDSDGDNDNDGDGDNDNDSDDDNDNDGDDDNENDGDGNNDNDGDGNNENDGDDDNENDGDDENDEDNSDNDNDDESDEDEDKNKDKDKDDANKNSDD